MALNNLGALHSEQNREEEARETYHEALKTYRELAQKQEAFLPYVAMTLSNLGNLESEQNRKPEARQAYKEALTIYEELALQDTRQFGRDVARVQRLLDQLQH